MERYLGIDLGITHTVTDSDGEFYSNKIEPIECIAFRIAAKAYTTGRAIAMENLPAGLSLDWMRGTWRHYIDATIIKTTCRYMGIELKTVWPAYTSLMCHACKLCHKKSRRLERFECFYCGYCDHADVNAAKNIAYRAECGIPSLVIYKYRKIITFSKSIIIPSQPVSKELEINYHHTDLLSKYSKCYFQSTGINITSEMDEIISKKRLWFNDQSIAGPCIIESELAANGLVFDKSKNTYIESNNIDAEDTQDIVKKAEIQSVIESVLLEKPATLNKMKEIHISPPINLPFPFYSLPENRKKYGKWNKYRV
jgi:hypothetical protein